MTTKSQNMEKSTTIPTILPSSRTCFTKRCHGTDPLPRYVWWEIFFWAPLIKDSCFSKCYMRIGQLIMTRRTGRNCEKYFRSSVFWFVFACFVYFLASFHRIVNGATMILPLLRGWRQISRMIWQNGQITAVSHFLIVTYVYVCLLMFQFCRHFLPDKSSMSTVLL